MIKTKKGRTSVLLRRNSKKLGYIFNPAGKSQESVEERMRKANEAWWRDARIHKAKTCRGELNAKTWWTKSTAFSVLAVNVGHGVGLSWTRSKDGTQNC